MKILRIGQVQELVQLSRTTIWRRERAGDFPARIRLAENSVGWLADEIEAWVSARPRGMASLRSTADA